MIAGALWLWLRARMWAEPDEAPLDPASERRLRPRIDSRVDARGNTGFLPEGPYGYDEGRPRR